MNMENVKQILHTASIVNRLVAGNCSMNLDR